MKEKYPNVRVLILTTFVDDEYVMKALAYGANGYILKGVSLGELKYAIETTMEGGSVLNPYVGAKMIHMMHTEKGLKMENQDHKLSLIHIFMPITMAGAVATLLNVFFRDLPNNYLPDWHIAETFQLSLIHIYGWKL